MFYRRYLFQLVYLLIVALSLMAVNIVCNLTQMQA